MGLFKMLLTGSKKNCLFLKINYTHHHLTKLIIILGRAQTPSCLFFHLHILPVSSIGQTASEWVLVNLLTHSMTQPQTNALGLRCRKTRLWTEKYSNTCVTRLTSHKKRNTISNSNWSIAFDMSIIQKIYPLTIPIT